MNKFGLTDYQFKLLRLLYNERNNRYTSNVSRTEIYKVDDVEDESYGYSCDVEKVDHYFSSFLTTRDNKYIQLEIEANTFQSLEPYLTEYYSKHKGSHRSKFYKLELSKLSQELIERLEKEVIEGEEQWLSTLD